MDLREIDLNLLVVFRQLLLERRVSKVAQTLGLSQPGVSNALRRLRALLQDELFVPTPRGMDPTPYALQLAESVGYALDMIQTAVNQRASFEPATSTRRFTVAMTDIGEIYFLPRLLERLAREAPGVSVSTVLDTGQDLKLQMEAGQVDLAIGLLPQLQAGYFQRRLFVHRYVCLFRRGHALDKGQISLAEFSAADHVAVQSAGTGHGQVDELLARRGVPRRIRLTVPHFVAVGHILASTDMVATVPERFAERTCAPFQLAYVPHPAPLPEIGINLFWHARLHQDPANQWLRGLLFELYGDAG